MLLDSETILVLHLPSSSLMWTFCSPSSVRLALSRTRLLTRAAKGFMCRSHSKSGDSIGESDNENKDYILLVGRRCASENALWSCTFFWWMLIGTHCTFLCEQRWIVSTFWFNRSAWEQWAVLSCLVPWCAAGERTVPWNQIQPRTFVCVSFYRFVHSFITDRHRAKT